MTSMPFSLVAIAAWVAALPVTVRVLGRVGYEDYRVVSAAPEPPITGEPEPYRTPATVPVRTATVRAVTDAWLAIGLLVVEKHGALSVRVIDGPGRASVAIPESRVFGAAPFVIRAQAASLAGEMIRALVPLLGPLRCRVDEQLSERTYGAAT